MQEQLRDDWNVFVQSPTGKGSDGESKGESKDDLCCTLRTNLAERLARREVLTRSITDKHRLNVRLQPAKLRTIRLPVMLCFLRVLRKQVSHRLTITWNPLTKRFDPISCSRCAMDTHTIGAGTAGSIGAAGGISNTGDLLCSRCLKHRQHL